jgi:cupin superfamily protein
MAPHTPQRSRRRGKPASPLDSRLIRIISPLATWWCDDTALARFRTRELGRRAIVLAPRDDEWRTLVPRFDDVVDLAENGLPFQIAAERRHERAPDPTQLRRALDAGATVLFPQAHQVLPRVARLIVALRNALLGPFREESSYLFLVEGRGREGMGLHHDGDVDAFWLQLEGRRTLTIGPRVAPKTPEDLDDARVTRGRGWRTLTLAPGSLAHLPARTPHRVVCHERSLALTLTWRRRRTKEKKSAAPHRKASRAELRTLAAWDVASGRAKPWPPRRESGRLWTQVPAIVASDGARGEITLTTHEGDVRVSSDAQALASRLATMPHVEIDVATPWLVELIALGILGDEDLPLVVVPDDPRALDGWAFA